MYLVDSHVFLWFLFKPVRLSNSARHVLADPGAEVFVSTVTFWELSLKHGLGRLDLEGVTPDMFPDAAAEAGLVIMPLDASVAASFHRLPREAHKDPFDRMLAWQAIHGGCQLISCDTELESYRRYGLRILW